MLETIGQSPSVVDMMLADKFGWENGDAALHLELKDDHILKEARLIEKAFGDLDAWLPAELARRGEMPADDAISLTASIKVLKRSSMAILLAACLVWRLPFLWVAWRRKARR